MSKIIICSDSTNDLSKELLEKHDIQIVPLYVCFKDKMYKDGVDINTKQLYEHVEKDGVLPKSSATSPEDFMKFFEKNIGKEGNDVIYTGIGSKLSSTLQNANIAKMSMDEEMAKHIYLIDSENLSTGIGLLLLKMVEFRDKGMTAQEIVDKVTPLVKKVRSQFSIKTLEYLYKGGRCSSLTKFFGTLARIRPILRVIDGKIIANEKVMGKYEKALDLQINDLVNSLDNMDLENVMITHSMADEEAKYILEHMPAVAKEKVKHFYVTNAGCVISTHCGPHTIGILYIKNDEVVK